MSNLHQATAGRLFLTRRRPAPNGASRYSSAAQSGNLTGCRLSVQPNVSAKNNVIVPHNFNLFLLERPHSLDRYLHISNRERKQMQANGLIEPIDAERRIWKLKDKILTEDGTRVRSSLVSVSVSRAVHDTIADAILYA